MLTFKKVKLYQYTIIFAKNCTIHISDEKVNEEIIIKKGAISLLERNLNIKVRIRKENDASELYDYFILTEEQLKLLIKILDPIMSFPQKNEKRYRRLNDKIHCIDGMHGNEVLFAVMKNEGENFDYVVFLLLAYYCRQGIK